MVADLARNRRHRKLKYSPTTRLSMGLEPRSSAHCREMVLDVPSLYDGCSITRAPRLSVRKLAPALSLT
jgi:hypothetical protein